MKKDSKPELFQSLIEKGRLKQEVYNNSLEAFNDIKEVIRELDVKYHKENSNEPDIPFVVTEASDLELRLKFAGDVLIFCMHSNVFEFSRDHEVMRTQYIKEDKNRSYCGIISIYNFLADSFKYNRANDVGYMIGRIFINKDKHYFIEGKKELGMIYTNFGKTVLDENEARRLVESAILFTINFDLLTPPYENVQEVSVREMQSITDSNTLKTGKRLGFRFQADQE